MTTGPPIARPITFAVRGASARTISSKKIACSISVAPRPPYSFGHEIPAHPLSCSVRCQLRANSNDSSSSPLGGLPGWFFSSHPRTSSRNAVSLGLSVRSIRPPLPGPAALDPLDQRACPKAAATAHRDQPDFLVGSLQLVQQRRDQARAARAERVAE